MGDETSWQPAQPLASSGSGSQAPNPNPHPPQPGPSHSPDTHLPDQQEGGGSSQPPPLASLRGRPAGSWPGSPGRRRLSRQPPLTPRGALHPRPLSGTHTAVPSPTAPSPCISPRAPFSQTGNGCIRGVPPTPLLGASPFCLQSTPDEFRRRCALFFLRHTWVTLCKASFRFI